MTFHCRSVPLDSDGTPLPDAAREHELEVPALECYAAPTWLGVSTFLFIVSIGLALAYVLDSADLVKSASYQAALSASGAGLVLSACAFTRTFKAEMRMR